jgi:hypothetical protein
MLLLSCHLKVCHFVTVVVFDMYADAVMCAWTTLKDEFGIVSTADLRIDYLENM